MAEDPKKEKTCFMAMPISTPPHLLDYYGNDPNHFLHVMECLFEPAIKAAGMKPIRPKAVGSVFIHAEIVENLQKADLVLVDMSSLNANVFWEFGVRSSLNKPLCTVMDESLVNIPFDTGIINAHIYQSRPTWTMEREVLSLTEHIRASMDRSKGKNVVWERLGFEMTAHPATVPTNESEKLDFLIAEVLSLKKTTTYATVVPRSKSKITSLEMVHRIADLQKLPSPNVHADGTKVVASFPRKLTDDEEREFRIACAVHAYTPDIQVEEIPLNPHLFHEYNPQPGDD